jgi:hypothetical protein
VTDGVRAQQQKFKIVRIKNGFAHVSKNSRKIFVMQKQGWVVQLQPSAHLIGTPSTRVEKVNNAKACLDDFVEGRTEMPPSVLLSTNV